MNDIAEQILRCLSVGGALSFALDGSGKFMVSYKTRDRSAWHCRHGDTPIEALELASASVRDDELPTRDILEAAAERRQAVLDREIKFAALNSKEVHEIDDEARAAVEQFDFGDLLG